jgi:RHS repeat-associated protein
VIIFHYNHLGYLISETTDTGQTLVEYIYLGNKLLALIQGEQVYYFHNDHLGTPQVLTNDSQTIAWKAVYTPFGKAVASIQTIENPFRFPGQYYDPETGLYYNYFRYYNPQTGRYITPDPIGLEGGINLFAYVANNPVNTIDTYGLLRVKPGFEREFEILNRYNPYIIAMLSWIEWQLPEGFEIEITEAFDQYKKLYPEKDKGWEEYLQNKHAALVALDIKVVKKEGSKCEGNVSNDQLMKLAKQAGFKGFGIYDLHLHIDFRDKLTTWKGESK